MLPESVIVAGLTIHSPATPACTWVNAVDGRVIERRVYPNGSVSEMEISHFMQESGYGVLYVGVNFREGTAIVSQVGKPAKTMRWLPWLQSFEGDAMHTEFVSFIAEQLGNGESVPMPDGDVDLGDVITRCIEDENELYDELVGALVGQYRAYPLDDDGLMLSSGSLARVIGRMAYEWAELFAEDVAKAMREDAEDRATDAKIRSSESAIKDRLSA